jgi:hypothetical protein
VSTREDKKNVAIILRRLLEEGYLEKDGKQNGKWRRIETDETVLDIFSEKGKALNVWLPFGINNLCHLYPKNIMVIAGVSGTGKTSILLNMAMQNVKSNKVYYFSSEMGEYELQSRLEKFECGKEAFREIRFVDRCEKFADVIRPNDINIIDYVEIYEEHYKMGLILKNIYDKLENGIAIVAIQKDPKKDFGVGGNVTREKARLYLNLDKSDNGSLVKIVKGKNWAKEGVNPDGMMLNYHIFQGAKLEPITEWYKDNSPYTFPTEEPDWIKGVK